MSSYDDSDIDNFSDDEDSDILDFLKSDDENDDENEATAPVESEIIKEKGTAGDRLVVLTPKLRMVLAILKKLPYLGPRTLALFRGPGVPGSGMGYGGLCPE